MDHLVCAESEGKVTDLGLPEPAESALISLARSGDRGAIETLCQRGWRPVYRSFARYTRDPAEAEDLTQEVFLRALRALPQFTDKGVPYTAYLLRIAANLARDRWRTGPARDVPVADLPERPSHRPGPDGIAIESDRRTALLSAVDELRPDQRAVLRLRILEGRTTGEVAALTNRSAAAVANCRYERWPHCASRWPTRPAGRSQTSEGTDLDWDKWLQQRRCRLGYRERHRPASRRGLRRNADR